MNSYTTSVRTLTAAMLDKQVFSGIEYLYLYAVEVGKTRILMDILDEAGEHVETLEVAHALPQASSALTFINENEDKLPMRFVKVRDVWQSELNRHGNTEEAKRCVIDLVNCKLRETGLSRRDLSEALSVNYSNLCAFLRGDTSRFSFDTAYRILQFVG